MTDLIDRIAGTDQTRPKINLHRFIAAERLYALGEWSRAAIATEFDLQGDEAAQAAQLADQIDARTDIQTKALYVLRVESVCMCIEDGDDRLYHNPDGSVNRLKVYEDLLIAG